MKYFKHFPKILYSSTSDSNGVLKDYHKCTNITVSAKFREAVLKNSVVFYPYVVNDGDRPDIIAHKYYGSPDYAWVVLLCNEMLDPLFDWPLTYQDFVGFLRTKYGSVETTQSTVKHYLNKNGFVIDYNTYLDLPESDRDTETIYDWEMQLNEDKREIQLLEDIHLPRVLDEFRTIMKDVG